MGKLSNNIGGNDFPSSLTGEEIAEIIGGSKVEKKNFQPEPQIRKKDKGYFVSDPFGDEKSLRVMM